MLAVEPPCNPRHGFPKKCDAAKILILDDLSGRFLGRRDLWGTESSGYTKIAFNALQGHSALVLIILSLLARTTQALGAVSRRGFVQTRQAVRGNPDGNRL
jgi:hypothetical protein